MSSRCRLARLDSVLVVVMEVVVDDAGKAAFDLTFITVAAPATL
jgi:hypothetical protein